jgi:S1-C subfamily serine protease/DNA-binding NarL/FixJ family response regulator
MSLLLLNLSPDVAAEVSKSLTGQGYELVTKDALTLEDVAGLAPEIVITEALPSDLSCCGLITQLKARADTKAIKVVMVVQGGALERARALDLGADDVISFPFEAIEFAARIRTQFRERQPEVELRKQLKVVEEKEHLAELAVESLSGGAITRRRFWVIPTIFVLSALAVLAALITSIAYRGSRKDTIQLKAELARLDTGVIQQSALLRRAELARQAMEAQGQSTSATRASLEAQSAEIRKKMGSAGGAEADSLKTQLVETQTRLNRLESEGKVAETIVHNYGPSVCLLHVVVEFLDKDTGKPIQISLDSLGKPRVDDKGMVQLEAGGDGPHLQVDVFGTGFLVRKDGRLITNHHVAEPWWNNEELKPLLEHGASAYVLSYSAYFPGSTQSYSAKIDRISQAADVATLRLEEPAPPKTALLDLDDRKEASISGEPVVLIGYPTGIDGILARAGSDVAQSITGDKTGVTQIVGKLASQKLIRPTTTQGHIGDILTDKIVYDAATTSGGSGGPLFNREGKVIGVNFAILNGFGGSNLAVPARYANDLLH